MIVVLNGSPNKDGNTVKLFNEHYSNKDYSIVNCYDDGVIACDDCQYCKYKEGCSKSDMDDIHTLLSKAEELVIMSPLYFGAMSSKVLDVISRFQTYYEAKFTRNEQKVTIPKITLVMTAAGSWPTMWIGAIEVIKVLCIVFDTKEASMIAIENMEHVPKNIEVKIK